MSDGNGAKKTIDERLDALTMNLELLSHSVEAHDRRFEKIAESLEKLVEVTNQDADAIRRLARIVEAHETRIDKLEDDSL